MRRHLLVLPLACLAALSLAGPASAQEDEVFVDPDSPTGREYDIPLERARRDASPGPSEPQSYRSRTAPLFGEGIDAAAEPTARAAARGSGEDDKARTSGRKARRSAAERRERLPRAVQAAIQQPGAPGDGNTAQLAGLAGALLVGLGVLGGIALRRSRR